MKAVEDMSYNPDVEDVVRILCEKTQSSNHLFFRVLTTFHLCMIASQMRVLIRTHDRGDIPVNMYALNLATSGAGKGFSTNILEKEITSQFRTRFLENFPFTAEPNLEKIALKRSGRDSTDYDFELEKIKKEFASLGPLVYSFDSGTPAAVKQMRHKLLLADAGAVNLIIDEIGSNLSSSSEVLTTLLELFDMGGIRQKITKVTAENVRHEEIDGNTPTNLMMFGTPSKLLDGGKTEDELISLLDTGYARRCFFSYGKESTRDLTLSAEEIYDRMTNKVSSTFVDAFSEKLGYLADSHNMGTVLSMTKETSLLVIQYKIDCERLADSLPEHEEQRKAEVSHRYFKALKAAGAYAFIDGSPELTETHFYQAVRLAEESGKAFELLLSRERPYVKLANYLGNCNAEVTEPDLMQDLPYYKGSQAARADMVKMAIAWGYKNNVIIKKAFTDGIEFLRGEKLKVTDLTKMVVSYARGGAGEHPAHGYANKTAPWTQLERLVTGTDLHWLNHHVHGGHRTEDTCVPGFNMIVLDIDGTMNLATAKMLMKDYAAIYYTTKRHTDDVNRFRIVLPTNYVLQMDAKEYKEFMKNVLESLPFEVDESCTHRSKKWMSHNANFEQVEGDLFDVLPFIPKTSKNEERQQRLGNQQQMDNLERWIINNTGDGNRNVMLHRYARLLIEAGKNWNEIKDHVSALNDKLADKLSENEILGSIMVTVGKELAARP
jgi:hypothetical protein